MIKEGLPGHSGYVLSVAFSPDGTCVASASADKTVILWDIRTHSCIGAPLSGHKNRVRSVAFSPCGTLLASGSGDCTVQLWDRHTGTIIRTLNGHSGHVMAVAFSPDGSCIASGSNDKSVRLWNVRTGQPIGQPFTEHSGCVLSVVFSSDGSYLISGSNDKTIQIRNIAESYPVVEPENAHPDTFCWPSSPYEISPHPEHPGWTTHDDQSLVFWLPAHYEQREKFLGPGQQALHRPVWLNYSKFIHGTAWTGIANDSRSNRSQ